MRWKPIGERELPNWAGVILVVPFMIVLSPVLLLIWIEQEWRRRYGPRTEWSEWFAWHPVRSDSGFGKTVWLETVQRRQWYGQIHYRTLDEANAQAEAPA